MRTACIDKVFNKFWQFLHSFGYKTVVFTQICCYKYTYFKHTYVITRVLFEIICTLCCKKVGIPLNLHR